MILRFDPLLSSSFPWVLLLKLGLIITQIHGQFHVFNEAVVISNVIGSGAMNSNHYFYVLGVLCENQNPSFWRGINSDYQRCTSSKERQAKDHKNVPNGSVVKMCRNWSSNEGCNLQFVRDLDICLKDSKGSNALAFMDAYLTFTCRNVYDTESQLTRRSGRFSSTTFSPGVFKCFPELQDRILTCIKGQSVSYTNQCRQLAIVQQCYKRYYIEARFNCNDYQVTDYLSDLFKHLFSRLRCEISGEWETDPFEAQRFNNFHNFKPLRNASFEYEISTERNKLSNYRLPSPTTPRPQIFVYPTLLPSPISPLQIPKPQKEQQYQQHFASRHPIQTLTDSSGSLQDEGMVLPLEHWFQLNTYKNLSDKIPKTQPQSWEYERYGDKPNGKHDRFYTFQLDGRSDEPSGTIPHSHGVYDIYQIHYDRYGLPISGSRGLSKRPITQNYFYDAYSSSSTESSTSARLNHLRRLQNDHDFYLLNNPNPERTEFSLPLAQGSLKNIRKHGKKIIIVRDDNEGESLTSSVTSRPIYNPTIPSPPTLFHIVPTNATFNPPTIYRQQWAPSKSRTHSTQNNIYQGQGQQRVLPPLGQQERHLNQTAIHMENNLYNFPPQRTRAPSVYGFTIPENNLNPVNRVETNHPTVRSFRPRRRRPRPFNFTTTTTPDPPQLYSAITDEVDNHQPTHQSFSTPVEENDLGQKQQRPNRPPVVQFSEKPKFPRRVKVRRRYNSTSTPL